MTPPPSRTGRTPDADGGLAEECRRAVTVAARELGVPPAALARRLSGGEIARLIHLLNAAHRHVENAGLRHRIEDLLMAVTDGLMPGATPESELDWALRSARGRREARDSARDEPPDAPAEPEG